MARKPRKQREPRANSKHIDNGTPIPYPKRHGHDDIKSYLVYRIRALKLDARTEVKTKGYGKPDIVVFNDDKMPVVIVEVKSGKSTKRFWDRLKDSKQFKRYLSLGIPLFYCKGFEMVNQTIQFVKDNALPKTDK